MTVPGALLRVHDEVQELELARQEVVLAGYYARGLGTLGQEVVVQVLVVARSRLEVSARLVHHLVLVPEEDPVLQEVFGGRRTQRQRRRLVWDFLVNGLLDDLVGILLDLGVLGARLRALEQALLKDLQDRFATALVQDLTVLPRLAQRFLQELGYELFLGASRRLRGVQDLRPPGRAVRRRLLDLELGLDLYRLARRPLLLDLETKEKTALLQHPGILHVQFLKDSWTNLWFLDLRRRFPADEDVGLVAIEDDQGALLIRRRGTVDRYDGGIAHALAARILAVDAYGDLVLLLLVAAVYQDRGSAGCHGRADLRWNDFYSNP